MSSYLDELLDPQKVSETKGSTLKNQLKVYREVEDKTKMLSELLQFRSDALTDKLAKLRQRCLNVLDEIATNTAVESLEAQSHQAEASICESEETNSIETSLIPETTEENPDNLFDLGF
jgi:hypothetical protein